MFSDCIPRQTAHRINAKYVEYKAYMSRILMDVITPNLQAFTTIDHV